MRYRSLYRQLGLSPHQTAEFEKLIAEQYWTISDQLAVQVLQNPKLSPLEHEQIKRQLLVPIEQAIQGLLGDEGYQRFRHHESTAYLRPVVETLAAKLFDGPHPLTAQQADVIVDILAANESAPRARLRSERWIERAIYGEGDPPPPTGLDVDWTTAVPQLREVLGPGQYFVIESEQQRANLRAQAAALRAEVDRALNIRARGSVPPR